MFKPIGFPNPFRIIKGTVTRFLTVQGPFLASGLAFDVLLYAIPLLFLVLSVMGFLLAGSDRAIEGARNVLSGLMPGAHQVITDNLSRIVAGRGRFGLIGFALFFVFSTTLFGSARTALNTVLEISHPRGFLKGKAVDLLMTLVSSGLFGLTIGLISVLTVFRGIGERLTFLAPILEPGWVFTSKVLGFLFMTVLFYFLYRFCPARTLGRRALWTASLTGAVLLEISKWAFAWYVSKAPTLALLYGTLSGLLFLFLWVYYACAVFLFAAAVGWALERENLPVH
jgi:membrane protein